MSVVDSSFDNPLIPEERASAPLMGGIMSHGFQCGMLWGAALAAGARAYQLYGPGAQAETGALLAAQRLVDTFRARTNYINCIDITDLDMHGKIEALPILKFFLKGGPIGCFRMSAGYGPEAFSDVNIVLSEEQFDVPAPPVSCTAVLAQKMGVSEMHMTMAAGLAGGIGLSGSACGALGAAIWIIGLKCLEEGVEKDLWSSEVFQTRAGETIDRFLQSSDYEFECSEVVGRKFESIDDHANYLQAGGCAEKLAAIAA